MLNFSGLAELVATVVGLVPGSVPIWRLEILLYLHRASSCRAKVISSPSALNEKGRGESGHGRVEERREREREERERKRERREREREREEREKKRERERDKYFESRICEME